jgi:hypothetical protein
VMSDPIKPRIYSMLSRSACSRPTMFASKIVLTRLRTCRSDCASPPQRANADLAAFNIGTSVVMSDSSKGAAALLERRTGEVVELKSAKAKLLEPCICSNGRLEGSGTALEI